jgi:hypothetical protein
VNDGEAIGAFKSNADCVAVIGFLKSLVLSTFPSPTIDFVIPDTVPVNVGLANGAFKSNAACCAAETGLFTSDVLSTLDNPTVEGYSS